jgi:hypothetical protein
MRCNVCGQEYLSLHSCSGTPVQIVEVDPPSARIKFPLFRYFMQGWEIVFWNDASIRRAGREPAALFYGILFWLIGASFPTLLLVAVSGVADPRSLLKGLGIGLPVALLAAFIQVSICHLIAKHLFDGTGTLVPLMRALFLGSVVTWLGIVPIIGAIAVGIGNTVVTMVVFEELDHIERMQAFLISAGVNIAFFIMWIYLLPFLR